MVVIDIPRWGPDRVETPRCTLIRKKRRAFAVVATRLAYVVGSVIAPPSQWFGTDLQWGSRPETAVDALEELVGVVKALASVWRPWKASHKPPTAEVDLPNRSWASIGRSGRPLRDELDALNGCLLRPQARQHIVPELPIFNRRRSLTDWDDILDMPPSIAIRVNRPGATHRALRSKMTKQLFLEHATCLYK
jgi:hypothetical protein